MKKLASIFLLAAALSACEDESGIDNRNRYFEGVEVVQLPNIQYDSDGSAPDLRVDLKRSSVTYWEFSSFSRGNANRLPVFLQFPSEVLATDEFYEIALIDEDPNELSDDVIFTWEFQAIEEGGQGIIEFFDAGELVMVLEYDLR